jgi:hypothetical protein
MKTLLEIARDCRSYTVLLIAIGGLIIRLLIKGRIEIRFRYPRAKK